MQCKGRCYLCSNRIDDKNHCLSVVYCKVVSRRRLRGAETVSQGICSDQPWNKTVGIYCAWFNKEVIDNASYFGAHLSDAYLTRFVRCSIVFEVAAR